MSHLWPVSNGYLKNEVRSRPPSGVWILLCVAAAGMALHGAYAIGGLGKPGLSSLFDTWVYNGVFLVAAVACVLRGVLVRNERVPWLLIASGLSVWLAGDCYWTFHLSKLEEIPYPSLADPLYVAGYPPIYAGIAMLTRARLRSVDRTLWLDGLIGALVVASVALAFLQPALAGSTEGDLVTVVVNLAYPLGDVVLLSLVVGAIALSGWRADAGWAMLAFGFAVTGVADVIYLQKEATTGYTSGTWPDTMWLVGAVAIAAAAWAPSVRHVGGVELTRRQFVLPGGFAFAAVGLQMYDHFDPVSEPAIWLAGAALVAVAVRMSIFFGRYATLLRHTQIEALTDALTGLGNRRALLNDLEQALEGNEKRLLAIFDLDGFKSYNDSFGHPAGDALLVRLGAKLAAAAQPHGQAYRLGGDEFCLLASLSGTTPGELTERASRALSEEGEAFTITSSHGAGLLPDEAQQASEALRLVDRRMYAHKGARSGSAEHQTATVLLRTLHEREPILGAHIVSVGLLAGKLARCLDLPTEDVDVIVRGAQLHDVGKMAIPDAVLSKPAPLDAHEWELMRGHTITGERIVASAPALLPVAKLVRSSHERWNGTGYPDGLAGEDIPLGARIVGLCDAYEAMIEDRPWQKGRSPEEALEELRRCAGTQFDPHLVEVFATRVFPWVSEDAADTPPHPAALASV
jgi:diguanylate cyclase (GGDEF)-like protein